MSANIYSQGIERFNAKDYHGAFKYFNQYIQLNPYSADAYYVRGLVCQGKRI